MKRIKEYQEKFKEGKCLGFLSGIKNYSQLKKALEGHDTVVDFFRRIEADRPLLGEKFIVSPENQGMVMDFTTKMGGCSNAYYSFIFQMPKWNFRTYKVSEYMAVSPVHAETYKLLVGQRQVLEGQIKQGLASVMQAVTDYELLRHDERRYREIVDYFKKGAKDDHVLRNLFVDRVDAYTGEGYSMISMAKRWPTIINDFIRMGRIIAEERAKKVEKPLSSTESIEKALDVPLAEATVLMTKNQLFEEWKELFKPVVMERYARIKAVADSRKESIVQYKEWLKPYVARHKAMKEMDHAIIPKNRFYAPAFGTSVAATGVRLWCWRPFPLEERRKPEITKVSSERLGFPINPFDRWARKWIALINIKYGTNYDDDTIEEMIKKKFTQKEQGGVPPNYLEMEVPGPWMSQNDIYYCMFDVNFDRSIVKTPPPEGGEIEDLMLSPIRLWVMSQNIMLIHLVELMAIGERFNREMNEMIGTSEEKLLEGVRDEMAQAEAEALGEKYVKEGAPREEKGAVKSMKNFVKRLSDFYEDMDERLGTIRKYLFRPGPYENVFDERVTKLYLVGMGGLWVQITGFWKSKFGVK